MHDSHDQRPPSRPRMIDLSVPISHDAPHEPWKPQFEYYTHEGKGLDWITSAFGVTKDELAHSKHRGGAFEIITTINHAGTHVDAPWHYAPEAEGKKAKTIDECPIEWFYSDGVVLDLRHKKPKDFITVDDLREALDKIDYTLKPFDIVMIMNGRDVDLGSTGYFNQPGMTKESTLWLVDQGIKVIGVDMYGFDRKFQDMADDFRETGNAEQIWQAHFAGIEREYCQIEKLSNLHLIPRPHGFQVSCLPVKIEGGSAGWCRAVAFV